MSSRNNRTWAILLAAYLLLAVLVACSTDDGSDDDDADDDAAGDDDTDDDDDDSDPDTLDELLKKFQPIVLQQEAANYAGMTYPESSDRIGQLSLALDPEGYGYAVGVDTEAPVVYAQAYEADIHGSSHVQLLYAYFYPERPNPYPPDYEDNVEYIKHHLWSGPVDGKVIRVTLDVNKEIPLLVEVARNCGCAWQLYVNQLVDDQMRAEFEAGGVEYPGLVKPWAPNDVPYVWIMPKDLADAAMRVVVLAEDGYYESPHHTLGAFTSYEQWFASGPEVLAGTIYRSGDGDVEIFDAGSLAVRDFALLDYEPLYHLAAPGEELEVGIFDKFGYIWNSYPPMYELSRELELFEEYPGTPRDLADLEVVHETIFFWDMALFDEFIYLPGSLFGPGAD